MGTYARFRTKAERHRPALFDSIDELQHYEQQPAVVHFTGPPRVTPSAYLNPWVSSGRAQRTECAQCQPAVLPQLLPQGSL